MPFGRRQLNLVVLVVAATHVFTFRGKADCQPCVSVSTFCVPPVQVGRSNLVTGLVTNCGDVVLTNVILSHNLAGHIATILTLPVGASSNYSKSVLAPFNAVCSDFSSVVTVRANSVCGVIVTNTATTTCPVVVVHCLQATKNCTQVALGQQHIISGFATNCGNVTLTNINFTDNYWGGITILGILPPNGVLAYSKAFLATNCGVITSFVTATGLSICSGVPVVAFATNDCVATCIPAVITNAIVTNSAFRMSFEAEASQTYTVQFKESLGSQPWATLTNIPGQPNKTNVIVQDPVVLATNRFYRVRSP